MATSTTIITLEELEALTQAYEAAYVEQIRDTAPLLVRSVNDLSVVVDGVEKTLSLYSSTNSSQPQQMTGEAGPFSSTSTLIGKGKNAHYKVVAGVTIPETAFSKYVEKCLSCDGRFLFEFEMLPDGAFFLQLGNILDEIEGAIGALNKAFSPNTKLIEQLCAFLNMLGSIACPQDLIALAMAIQLMINRKMTYALQIKLNWWGLFGFAIKWFIETLSSLIDQLAQMLEAPLKCLLAALTAGLETVRAFDAAFTTASNTPNKAALAIDPKTQRVTFSLSGDSIFDTKYEEVAVAPPNVPTELVTGLERGTSIAAISAGGIRTVPDSAAAFDAIQNVAMAAIPNIYDLSLPEQLVLLNKTAIEEIEALRLKIQEALGSVKRLVSNNKILEIRLMLDIKFLMGIAGLLVYLGSLDSLSDLCRPENAPNLTKIIEDMTGAEDVQLVRSSTTNSKFDVSYSLNGKTNQTSIASCLAAREEAESAAKNLDALLRELSNG
jgi:hypothetical protein